MSKYLLAVTLYAHTVTEARSIINMLDKHPELNSAIDADTDADDSVSPTEAAASIETVDALDSAGVPWDARIHSSTKATNADGSWRYKRGLDKGVQKKVEAELSGTMQVVFPAPSAPALPAPSAPALPAPPSSGNPAFTNFVQFIVANTRSPSNPTGRLTDDYVRDVLLFFGIAEGSLQNLAHRTDKIAEIETAIRTACEL